MKWYSYIIHTFTHLFLSIRWRLEVVNEPNAVVIQISPPHLCICTRPIPINRLFLSYSLTFPLIQDAIGNSAMSQDIEIEIQGVSPIGFEVGKLLVETV